MSIQTLEQILNEKQQYSQFSDQPSFTLTDILQQPLDQDLIQDIDINQDNMNDFFQDQDMFQDQQNSNVYQFPKQNDQQNNKQQNQIQEKSQRYSKNQLQKPYGTQKKMKTQQTVKDSQRSSIAILEQKVQRHQRLKRMPFIPLQQINNISFVVIKNVTALFQDPNNHMIGIPTAIAVSGDKFLAVGTSMGNIAVFQIGIKGYKILGSSQQRKYGSVLSLSISKDNKYIVAGHQTGLVAVWDLYYFSLVKQQINDRSKIIQVIFCSNTFQNFISNDVDGNIYIYTIQKYLFTNLKSQKLLQKTNTVFYDVKFHQSQTGDGLLALCSLQFVLLIQVKPQVRVIGKIVRPDGLSSKTIPNIQMGQIILYKREFSQIKPVYDILLISWGKSLYIYRLIPSLIQGLLQIQQLSVYTHESTIYHIEYYCENVFGLLDNHQIFKTIRIQTSISNQNSQKKSKPNKKDILIQCYVINNRQISQQIIYQRLLKTKESKYLKSFNNTIVHSSTNSQNKQIFFISKNSIYRARLHKWKDYLSELINQQNNLKMALKFCIQLKNQNLNIFAEKVQIKGKKGQKNLNVFCQAGKVFFEQSLKNIKKSNISRAKNIQRAQLQIRQISQQLRELYEYIIEYFVQINCQNYLFNQIYMRVIKNLPCYEYWQLFIQSLIPFILNEKLKKIPNIEIFKQILNHFSQNKSKTFQVDNLKLIDKMIINLDPQSLHYEQTISILSQNRLYNSLSYICSMNKDFISPCSKLLTKIIQANTNKHQNAQKQYYQILKNYLLNLVQGKFINQRKLDQKIYQTIVLRDLTLWLSFQDTLNYFIKNKQIISNQISDKLKLCLMLIHKLFQSLSNLQTKNLIHQFLQHMIESLQKLQNKLNKKQNQSLLISKQNRLISINILRYQIMKMLQKYSSKFKLSEKQLTFYISTIYNYQISSNTNKNILKQNYIQLTLQEEFIFLKNYFAQLHYCIKNYAENQKIQNLTQLIFSSKNQWIKYQYNFIVRNCIQNENQLKEKQNNIIQEKKPLYSASELLIQTDNLSSKQNKFSSQRNIQFQKLMNFNSNKSLKQPQLQKIYIIIKSQLNQLQLSVKIQDLFDEQSKTKNSQLVSFLIKNFTFNELDRNISSLLKLNTQITIVYLLENYQIDLVNEKIQSINNQETKFFVVRKILKIIRKRVKQLKQNMNKDQRIVWGNKFRTFAKKQLEQKNKKNEKVSSLNDPNAKLSKQIMLFYFKCLVKYKRQKRVYSELHRYMNEYENFIQQILQIVTQSKLNSCIALIYLHLKNYQKAIQFYQYVYNEIFELNLQKLTLVQYCHGRFLKKIFQQMLFISQIMNKQQKWMNLLQTILEPLIQNNKFLRKKKQKVIELIQKVYDNYPNHAFILQLSQIIEFVLVEVSSKIKVEKISQVLDLYSELMNKTFMLNCLKSTMRTYSKSIFIYEISNSMVVNDQVNQFQSIYYNHKIKGINYVPTCESCNKILNYQDKTIAFKCGHMYHKDCFPSDQQRCIKCVLIQVGQKENEKYLMKEMSNIEKKQSIKQSSIQNIEIKQQDQIQIQQEQQIQKANIVYRCLAFEQFLLKENQKFEQFRKEYDGYISKYD